ncbi:DUF421 domain-containing protein [Stagnimonas aquatica]|uniref:DUF421 domain-containing protein n=1 Tax=Stagnimonas aquatica TaxID=2689987 RepID=A0A3N0UZN9_9GAMM|nr:YetF domain-containing protein [Stagnimonas aquatica]ROH86019.1 DUF421 domain-containing protein [Stagnimonas aquatica]
MFDLAVPLWELVLRAIAVYGFLLLMLRLTGKRQVGQLAPFDFVLLLILSNAVQNSMNAGDNSLVGGLVSAATLVALNYLTGLATFRSRRIEKLVDGEPELLIHEGRLFPKALARAQISEHELYAALRQNGCTTPETVALAMLETNGVISVVPRRG